jgi:hypothetical protein
MRKPFDVPPAEGLLLKKVEASGFEPRMALYLLPYPASV